MISRKWFLTLAVSIYLTASGVTALGTPVQQIFNQRGVSRLPLSGPPPSPLTQTSLGLGRTTPIDRRIGVVSVLPRNAREFESVHGRRPSRTEFSNMAESRLQLRRNNQYGLRLQPTARTSKGFADYAKRGKEKIVLLEGHNDKGNFRFADGGSLPLADIDALLRENGKQGIYASCDARRHVPRSPATKGKITYRGARIIRESIGNGINGRGPFFTGNSLRLDVGRVQENISRIERRLGRTSKLKRSAAGAAGAGTLYLLDRWGRKRKQ